MKVNIYPIVSSLHEQDRINSETKQLLKELENQSSHEFNVVSIEELYDADLSLILIQSGGREQLFLKEFENLKQPYYLLTYGHNNSLAASLEILSFLKDNDLAGEVLHGDTTYLSNRINELLKVNKTKEEYRYGVIGKPSDWLISSNVNYDNALEKLKVKLVDIDINQVVENYNQVDLKNYDKSYLFEFDNKELNEAKKMYLSLLKLKQDYNLDGLTIRCFDLLSALKTTSCLGLSILNADKIVSTCEGDIPTMLSMHVIKQVTNQVGFQANPSRINITNKEMVLAHCTLPLDMCKSYSLDTHFESSIGVAVKGKLKEQEITIFKLSKDLNNYYVNTGKIIENLNEDNLCRTQIKVRFDDDISYFLNRPYGNHHVIIYGNHKEKLIEYMEKVIKHSN